jgi:hypothetical protein
MSDKQIYRISGISALAAIAVCLVEYPFYFVRGAFPGLSDSAGLVEFTARNAHNIYSCLVLDLVILTGVAVFLGGFRHLIRTASAQHEWLATIMFGLGMVYITLTLAADALQAGTAIDAQSPSPDATVIRAMNESMLLMYGEVPLFLMGAFMALGSGLAHATRALPAWSAWVGYACAAGCFAFLPAVYVGRPDPMGFYNAAGWGSNALAAGIPIVMWMAVVGILMLRLPAGKKVDSGPADGFVAER